MSTDCLARRTVGLENSARLTTLFLTLAEYSTTVRQESRQPEFEFVRSSHAYAFDKERRVGAARKLEGDRQVVVARVRVVRLDVSCEINGEAQSRPLALGKEKFANSFDL